MLARFVSRRTAAMVSTTGAKALTVRDALNSALDEELTRDSKVIIMGEEGTAAFLLN
jgi:hypothetical protein